MKKTLTFLLASFLMVGSAFAVTPSVPDGCKGLKKTFETQVKQKSNRTAQSGFNEVKAPYKAKLNTGADNLLVNPSKKVRTKPRFNTGGGSTLYGYLIYSINGEIAGVYDATQSYPELVTYDPLAYEMYDYGYDVTPATIWYEDGVTHALSQVTMWGMFLVGEFYYEYDNEGNLLSYEEVEIDPDNVLLHACKVGNNLYGVGYAEGVYGFLKAPATDCLAVSMIAPLDAQVSAICYNEDAKCFYAADVTGALVEIDLNGNETVLIDADDMYAAIEDFIPNYTAGMVYLPNEKMVYYNPQTETLSYLYSYNPATKELQYLLTYENGAEFNMMYTTDKKLSPYAPNKVENLSVAFDGPAVNGQVSFTMPENTIQGDPLEGKVKWTVELDGAIYNLGYAAPGEDVVCKLVSMEEGQHSVIVYATANDREGMVAMASVYVGKDVPATPQDVQLAEDGYMTWDAVKTGAHNGYIDVEGITYQVYINDEPVGNPTAETAVTVELPATVNLERISASVIASYDDIASEPGYSSSILIGNPLELPVVLGPTAEDEYLFTTYSTVFANWVFSDDYFDIMNCFFIESDAEKDLDAWLILPPVSLPANQYIDFSLDAMSLGDWVTEEFEVCIGTSTDVDDMKVVQSGFNPEVGVYNPVTVPFSVEEAGTYYIAIHGVSEAWGDGMAVRNFAVNYSKFTGESPREVTNLEATAALDGSLFATVSFTFPTKSLDGTEYPEDTELSARVECVTFTNVTGKPGEKIETGVGTRQSTIDDLNTITVTTYYGELPGMSSTVSVYTGVDYPTSVDPDSFMYTVNEDGLSATLTWAPVTEGATGLYFDPENVRYLILEGESTIFGYQWYEIDEVSSTEYVYSVPAGTEQSFHPIGILAVNDGGEAEDGPIQNVLVGQPDALPQICDLANATDANPIGIYSLFIIGSDMSWAYSSYDNVLAQLGDIDSGLAGLAGGNLIIGEAEYSGAVTGIITGPMFSTEGVNDACFELTAYTGTLGCTFNLYGVVGGPTSDDRVLLGTMERNGGWSTATFKLPAELQNRGNVMVFIEAEIEDGDMQLALIRGFKAYSAKTGVELVSSSKAESIQGGKGVITFKGLDGKVAEISNIDGAKVAIRKLTSGLESITVNKGVYVVKAGDKKSKVLVK